MFYNKGSNDKTATALCLQQLQLILSVKNEDLTPLFPPCSVLNSQSSAKPDNSDYVTRSRLHAKAGQQQGQQLSVTATAKLLKK
jgi:hypothetical protein